MYKNGEIEQPPLQNKIHLEFHAIFIIHFRKRLNVIKKQIFLVLLLSFLQFLPSFYLLHAVIPQILLSKNTLFATAILHNF